MEKPLTPQDDKRNVIDTYKGLPVDEIRKDLAKSRSELEIAVENLERDFNMGTIIRNANAFNVKRVHVIGRRQWNKRGAMKTDAYLDIVYHTSAEAFLRDAAQRGVHVLAIDITPKSIPLHAAGVLPRQCVLVFGSEGDGLSEEFLRGAEKVLHIEQFGSTRSVNVGVASGIAMYAWIQQHRLC